MPVFEDYSKNGELLQVRDEPLTTVNFCRYVKVTSIEQAEGYLVGLDDLLDQLDYGGYTCRVMNGTRVSKYGSSTVGRNIIRFHEEKVEFLNFAKNSLVNFQKEGMTITAYNQQPSLKERLNNKNIGQFIKENGIEKAQGYLDAVKDMTKQINSYFNREVGQEVHKNSLYVIGSRTEELLREKYTFVWHAKKMLEPLKLNSNKADNSCPKF